MVKFIFGALALAIGPIPFAKHFKLHKNDPTLICLDVCSNQIYKINIDANLQRASDYPTSDYRKRMITGDFNNPVINWSNQSQDRKCLTSLFTSMLKEGHSIKKIF